MTSSFRYRLALVLLSLAALAVRLYIWDQEAYLHTWDEKFHALVAKNMTTSPLVPRLYPEALIDYDYKDWTANHIWLHKMPLFLWESALSMKAFGVSLFTLRLPSLIKITLLPLLVAHLAERLVDRRTALIACLFAAFSFQLSMTGVGALTTDHSDISLLFYFTVALLSGYLYLDGSQRRYLLGLIIASAAAMMSKWIIGLAPILITLMAAALTQRYDHLPRLLCAILFSAAPLAVWMIYTHHAFPIEASYELGQLGAHASSAVEGHHGGADFYLSSLFDQYGPLVFICFLLATYSYRRSRLRLYYLILVPITIVAVFSAMSTKMHNYILIASPLLWITMSAALVNLSRAIKARGLRSFLLSCLVLISLWSIAKPDVVHRYLHQDVVGHFIRIPDRERQLQMTASIRELDIPDGAVITGVQSYDYIDFMYYHDVLAYPSLSPVQLAGLAHDRAVYQAKYPPRDSSTENKYSVRLVSISNK